MANCLAHALVVLGRTQEASAAAAEAAARFPEDARIQFLAGKLHERAEDWPRAEAAFRAALALSEDHAEAHLHLCEALRQQKKLKEAVAAFRRGEALGPPRDHLRLQRFRLFGEL